MFIAAKTAFILLLLLIAWQDFKARSIYWWLPVLVFAAAWVLSCHDEAAASILKDTLINCCVVILLLAVLALYVLIKYKTMRAFASERFGLGDILMLLSICPLTGPVNFILFMCVSNILMLCCELLKRISRPSRETTIPYAGYLGLFLIAWTLLTFCLPDINYHSDYTVYFLFSATP